MSTTTWPCFRIETDGETRMNNAKPAGRSGVMTVIRPRTTGHTWAQDGTLLRVDCARGIGWFATHYDPNLHVIAQVRGSDEEVHRVASYWARRWKQS
jgi:hypothetical protein